METSFFFSDIERLLPKALGDQVLKFRTNSIGGSKACVYCYRIGVIFIRRNTLEFPSVSRACTHGLPRVRLDSTLFRPRDGNTVRLLAEGSHELRTSVRRKHGAISLGQPGESVAGRRFCILHWINTNAGLKESHAHLSSRT